MAGLLDLCEKYFDAREFYEVLKIPKTADQKQGNAIFSSNITSIVNENSFNEYLRKIIKDIVFAFRNLIFYNIFVTY